MRTIEEIKREITSEWMNDSTMAAAYGITAGATWDEVFSKVSVENVLCYIIAAAIWTHEKLFEAHREEVEEIISGMKPHSLRWYVTKAKEFRAGQELVEGTDGYDDAGLTSEVIEARRVVKFAAASEGDAVVYVKVAGEVDGVKSPLTAENEDGLKAYLAEVKDAGVRVEVINEPADKLRLSLMVYYDPMVLSGDGTHLATGTKPVEDTVKAFIENLPFNGEYRNDKLVDALQELEGVDIPEVVSVSHSYDGVNYGTIETKARPVSGYYAYDDETLTVTYEPYEQTI